MDKTIDKKKPQTRKQKLRKALKVKFSKVTILAGFVTGVLVCLC